MIISDFKHHKGLMIEGDISEVSTECILIMREIYKRNREVFSNEVAIGILTNMLIKAINGKEEKKVEWKVSEEEKLGYTE